ncbi:hypothetical protein M9H77_18564 [Catharanthus roseus]|uniref:Uncharacterized protein n=1 Tax=Catharanthus roseus TaxID=4058 RepID=A0ACC0B7V0_CATRO|nr:hypothetical protein M9H77_18564 [Catharanthus roseus]
MKNTMKAMIIVPIILKDITLALTINAFYENGSYGDESTVERRLIDSGDIVGRKIDRKNGDGDLNFGELSKNQEERLLSLWDSYTCQVSLISDMCIIAFEGNLFLLVPSLTDRLSSYFSLEDLLMSSSIMFDPSCYGFGNLDDTSLVELNIHVCTITSTRGRRHTMEFEGQGENVGGKLILFYGDLTMSFSSNLFLFYLVLSFKELKLFLQLNALHVILVGNCMVNLFTCELVLDIDYRLKYSSPYAFLEKQHLVSISRIKPSYYSLELLHDNLLFDRLIANVSTSCAPMWSRICIFLRTFTENCYDERVRCFFWTLCDDFHAKFKGEFVENCDYDHISLILLRKILMDLFFPYNLLCLVSYKFEFLHEE